MTDSVDVEQLLNLIVGALVDSARSHTKASATHRRAAAQDYEAVIELRAQAERLGIHIAAADTVYGTPKGGLANGRATGLQSTTPHDRYPQDQA